jgi:hypothetical protein
MASGGRHRPGPFFNAVWKQVFGDIGDYRLVEYGEISESAIQFMDPTGVESLTDDFTLLQFTSLADSRIAGFRSSGMSWPELRAGVGLLLAVALIIGWSLGIGLPLAAVIIWLFS